MSKLKIKLPNKKTQMAVKNELQIHFNKRYKPKHKTKNGLKK